MTASFRRIDYSLRPSKHAERRMLGEIFRRLRPFQPVEDYVYVGFGSVWFTDFALFHRTLGVRNMLSIERQADAKPRIDANKPFASVAIDYRSSDVALPDLDWTKRHFIWLDYDDPLTLGMLMDARSVAARARSGTVTAISVQCQKAAEVTESDDDQGGPSAFARFEGRFGRERLGADVGETDLFGWKFGKIARRLLSQEIESALVARNAGSEREQVLTFKPICSFEYEDGVKMTTLVGVFVSNAEAFQLEACHFQALDFISEPGKPVRIPFPKITPREARMIEQTLPWATGTTVAVGAIPPSDARDFAGFYRYWPSYAVLEG
ncbi:O-methyltransferase [Mesorhizobium sp. L2C066B000]|uniref:O-methyltransferase n=1 Tax=Mesorhizobium sp. L2C066B000 TaxID=1287105 RepID=UPI0003D04DC0|nr:O-methyltransferase [Mesorhizobium sp. L2C066B000]ESZ38174.1 hypothetical protein X732_19250 [Mesorhizobium sp. L2C066B000]